MSALCNVLGSTPGPFPGEDTKTTAKTSGRSANLVIMGEYCCFFFASLLAYSQLTSYCRKSISDATRKDSRRAGSQGRFLYRCPNHWDTRFGKDGSRYEILTTPRGSCYHYRSVAWKIIQNNTTLVNFSLKICTQLRLITLLLSPLSWPDVSALCIPPTMVNERIEFSKYSRRVARHQQSAANGLYEKGVTWFGSARFSEWS